MKYIKTYEDAQDNIIYYAYIDIEKLESFINILKEYNVKYTLNIIKKDKEIGLFSVFKTSKKMKEKMGLLNFHISDNPDVAVNIITKSDDVTDLSISEIKDIFNTFEESKKYNL